ncbi:stealth conserved region 3 domain-containing protein [Glutamicibacter sp.]|uniref:stealth conserved region 3 domain-containing protein n=1 Tax=Glutamicibacter sp. TaxID=1931995 RepID=UPI002B49826E|nr:stealth conserved region 3 domain-containing protein [Glutamicibacter sp.]
MDFAGWRGTIGQVLPQRLVQQLLKSRIRRVQASDLSSLELREVNETAVRAIADSVGIEYTWDENSCRFVIGREHWNLLQSELRGKGLFFAQLAEAGSYSASESWSVSTTPLESGVLGAGVLWNVFPSNPELIHDVMDYVGPIDAVYTWVDSTDPSWHAAYEQAKANADGHLNSSSTDPGRFASHDELRFSLRSLELNLPWINHIYLVTAGQTPSWLMEEHPKITIVDHTEILDAKCLPTFNSHAIESRLSFIPGLAERFLYINDDVFFGRPVSPNVFYGPAGQTKFSVSPGHFMDADETELPVNSAARNNQSLIRSTYHRTTSRKFKHVAHPQLRSIHELAYKQYPEELALTAGHQFRHPRDISLPSSLAHQLAARTAMGYPTEIDYSYLDIGDSDFALRALRLTRGVLPQMFCLNEVRQASEVQSQERVIKNLFRILYPYKSSFEK